LLYFTAILSILRPFCIFHGPLVYLKVICYLFPRFGMLYQEISGNPESNARRNKNSTKFYSRSQSYFKYLNISFCCDCRQMYFILIDFRSPTRIRPTSGGGQQLKKQRPGARFLTLNSVPELALPDRPRLARFCERKKNIAVSKLPTLGQALLVREQFCFKNRP
jgi:hypothetical protein